MVKLQGEKKIVIGEKKVKKVILFVDLDGVMSFWEKSAAKLLDIDYNDEGIREELKNGKKMEDFVGGDEKMWPIIDKAGEDFWSNMEKFSWSDDLIEIVKNKSSDFCFLTSPSKNPICASGKIKWMQKNYKDLSESFFIGKDKHLCASNNSVLIDDSDKKCKKFEEYGGHSFKWPHPLKIIDGDIKIEDIFNSLKEKINQI